MTAAFGKMPAVTPPKEPDPVRLPSPDDPEALMARKKKMQDEMLARSGKSSTQLSGDSATQQAYSRTTLG